MLVIFKPFLPSFLRVITSENTFESIYTSPKLYCFFDSTPLGPVAGVNCFTITLSMSSTLAVALSIL